MKLQGCRLPQIHDDTMVVHILNYFLAKKYQDLHGQSKPEKKKPEKKAEKPKV